MTKILTKLHAIMADVSYIQKDKKNTHQGYSYASEKAIKEEVHAALVKHSVIFTLSTSNPRVENGVTWIDCAFRFLDVESGEELAGTFLGSGSARDEKGHYAAVTGAIKYALTSTLLIPTGDDPENDEAPATTTKAPKPATAAPASAPSATPIKREFAATNEQLAELAALVTDKLGAKTKPEILPALNAKFGTTYKVATEISRNSATAFIGSLKNLKEKPEGKTAEEVGEELVNSEA